MVWGRTMSGSRFFVVWCLWRGSMGCELTVIVWIARPCVDHCVLEKIMKCLNVFCANPSPFMLLRYIMHVKVLFWKRMFFVFQNNNSHVHYQSMAYFTYMNLFWEWTHLNGGIPKEFDRKESAMCKKKIFWCGRHQNY